LAGEAAGGAFAVVPSQAMDSDRATLPRIVSKRAGKPNLFMGRMAAHPFICVNLHHKSCALSAKATAQCERPIGPCGSIQSRLPKHHGEPEEERPPEGGREDGEGMAASGPIVADARRARPQPNRVASVQGRAHGPLAHGVATLLARATPPTMTTAATLNADPAIVSRIQ